MNAPLTKDEMIRVTITMNRDGKINIQYNRQDCIPGRVADTITAGLLAQVLTSFKLVATPEEPT